MDEEGDYGNHGRRAWNRRKYCVIAAIVLGVVAIGAGIGIALTAESDDTSSQPDYVPSPSAGRPSTPGPTPTNAPNIRQIVLENSRFGGSEFDDANTYQSRALEWVLTQEIPLSNFPDLSQEEQTMQLYALACLFYATYAIENEWTNHRYGSDVALPRWVDSKGWVTDASNMCDWYGLTCNGKGQVVKIELDANGLTGSIPPEITYLKESLQYMDLFRNLVHNKGDEGNTFLGELKNMKYLYYGETSFEYDGIPTEIGLLTNLVEYDCSYTLYFGNLDGQVFSQLSNLNYLNIDGNSYNSTLPQELVDLPQLEYLYAGNSFIEGNLDFISQMPMIYELWIDENPGIKGTIPASLGTVSTLASWSATGCSLTGSLPAEIGQMTDLVQLWLYDNKLTGTIPASFGALEKVKLLQFQKNDFEGTMPEEVCTIKRPLGRLETLEADCDGEVECPSTCCTCCGEQCIDVRRRSNRKHL
eukprot:scaffold1992_cov113-Cylindrotheca_fusiformis.AAC.20